MYRLLPTQFYVVVPFTECIQLRFWAW